MLRLHLPPNLAAAAPRDAIAVRVDVDLSAPPAPGLLPALALLQRWCGTPTPPKFLQLTRAQLRELATALAGQPVFVEDGRATTFRHDALLAEPKTASSSAVLAGNAPPPGAKRNTSASAGPPPQVDGSEHYLAITLPSREHPAYAPLLELLKTNGFVLDPGNRKWWLRDRHKTLNFLAAHGARLRDGFGAEFTANFERNTAKLETAGIATEIATAADARGAFDVAVGLQAGSATDGAIRAALAANRGYIEADGKLFLLDTARVRQLETAQRALAGAPAGASAGRRTHRVSAARVTEVESILDQLSPGFQAPETWRARTGALRDLTRLTPAPLPADFDARLRPYQRLGVAWLCHLHRHELGGILADEMGLGKTLQALGLLCAVHAQPRAESPESGAKPPPAPRLARALDSGLSASDSPRASLVVCPASLLENWRRESARFAPQLRVFVHHGDHRLASADAAASFDLIVTSYGTLTRDWERFNAIAFTCVIADEAQHIKNRRSQNAAALRSLRARSRFLLTGTPLENSLDDLRSLFEFLLPGYLDKIPAGLRADERAWFDDRLRAKVAPYILRRTKQSVAPELPAKLEQVLWCELTPAQAALYRETQQRGERELFDLEAGGASEAKLRVVALTQLLRLRQICCDPRLLPDSELRTPVSATRSPSSDLRAAGAGLADSAKLDAFRELLAEMVDDGHRVLVFSQFTALLGLLREELAAQETACCYLDGSMAPRARQAEVDRFQADASIPVFLISLKAGGTGLNLTGADTVVHFDPWWNPAAEAQATDRAHRIGQTRVVTSYKLIAGGTVEEKVLALQDEKRALLAGVFEASDAANAKLSLTDLKSLLA